MSRETEFVRSWFSRYYETCPPPAPERFGRREFGFMFIDRGFVQRHICFSRVSDLHDFLVRNTPAHTYYSSAYYENPAAATMEEKGWLGADLIFDLDADHIESTKGLSYEEMLSIVKRETMTLVDSFLLGDLGFSLSDLRIVFSGGRGYHIHISSERVMRLKSHERREIVDYLSGTDLNLDWVFPEKASFEKSFRQAKKVHKVRLIPAADSGGWRRRARMTIERLVDRLENASPAEVREAFRLESVSDAIIGGMLADLYAPRGGKRGRDLILEKGRLEDFSDRRHQALFMKLVDTEMRRTMSGHVDEPVTSDIKRLIRLPFSLHGKTALVVTPLTRDELDHFDPLRDAVAEAFPGDPVRIIPRSKIDMRIGGERVVAEEETEVPGFAALFLVCRGMADLA